MRMSLWPVGHRGDYWKDSSLWDWLKIVQSYQKSYVDLNWREVEYDVSEFVFPKVSLISGVIPFGIKGKLVPRYMGLFEVIERIGEVTYRLNLPLQLGHVHNVFHLSILKKYACNPSHVLPYANIPFQADVTYEEWPAKILAGAVYLFHHKETPMVKVL